MFGASLLKIIKFGFNFTKLELAILLIGMFTAFIVSVFIIKFLWHILRSMISRFLAGIELFLA